MSVVVDILLLQAISLGVASASIVVGVIYYILQIRNQTTIRKTDLLTRLYSLTLSREYVDASVLLLDTQFKDYEEYVKKYGSMSSMSPTTRALFAVVAPYELVGTLLYRKQIDIGFVFDFFGTYGHKMLYEKFLPVIKGGRKEFGEPAWFVGFEYLHDELSIKEPQFKKSWGKYLSQPTSDIKSPDQSSR